MTDKPLITVKEARKLLGIEAKALSDQEISLIIAWLTQAARESLAAAMLKNKRAD